MAGMFDDLIPAVSAKPGGMFDDLIAAAAKPAEAAPQAKGAIAKALEPITSLPATSDEMQLDARRQMGRGVDQISTALRVANTPTKDLRATEMDHDPAAGGGAIDLAKGIGNVALGSLGYVASPVNALLRTVAGKPIEENTGLPKEYTEFAGAMVLPIPKSVPWKLTPPKSKATAPTIAELKTAARAGYEAPEVAAVEIKGAALPQAVDKIRDALTTAGIDENLAPKTFGILAKASNVSEDAIVTVANLQSLRRTLGNAAGSIDKTERLAAVRAKNGIDDFLENLPEGAVIAGDGKKASDILKEANANYGAAERAAILDRTQVRAELRAAAANSGQNVANTIRQRLADILINPKLQRGFSESELAQMERIVRGTPTENVLRGSGKMMGGGGGLGAVVTGGVAASAGHTVAGLPGMAVAVIPAIGYGLTKLSNKLAANQMDRLNIAVRANSPLGRQVKAPLRDWSDAAQEFELSPSFKNFARLSVASRNLSNNLKDIGVAVSPDDILRSLQGPVRSGAGAEQAQPDAPRVIDQQP